MADSGADVFSLYTIMVKIQAGINRIWDNKNIDMLTFCLYLDQNRQDSSVEFFIYSVLTPEKYGMAPWPNG